MGWRGAVAAAEVHGAVRGVDVGGGYGPGFALQGSPWREARPSLKLSGSEREREREVGGGVERGDEGRHRGGMKRGKKKVTCGSANLQRRVG